MSLSREFPGQKTFTMTREVVDKGAADAFMAAEEEATAVMTAATLMKRIGLNTVRLKGPSTGRMLRICRPGKAGRT